MMYCRSLGFIPAWARRVQKVWRMEHILLVLDPARQEGELVEKAVQVDLIVDVVEIGLAVDNVNLVFHIHASLSQKSNSMLICPPQSIIRRRSFPWGVIRVCWRKCPYFQKSFTWNSPLLEGLA